jgi:cytochrome c oxidase assembly protein subunit 11
MNRNIKQTSIKFASIAVLMFGFGYLLVPLYDVICDITGFNGKTGTISINQAHELNIDNSRLVTVDFDTNINSNLPWSFKANSKKISVHPGEIGEVSFSVMNLSKRSIVGQAIPSVVPSNGSIYFNKTECFCFTQQLLEPGEHKEMSVRFVIDPALPTSINALVLSYTFFLAPGALVNKPVENRAPENLISDDGKDI